MKTLNKPFKPINVDALDEHLRARLPAVFTGLSTNSEGILLHFEDSATVDDYEAAERIFDEHDPAIPSTKQAKADYEKEKLFKLRRDYGNGVLNVELYKDADPLLKLLAEQVALLQAELRAVQKPI